MKSVFHDCKVTVLTATVADNETITFRGVDMAADGGYEGVAFVFGVVDGSVVTTFVPKAQQDSSSTFGTDVQDIAGTANTFGSITGVKTICIDILKPTDRYVRPILAVPNTAATCVVCCTAIQYKAREAPATQDATTTGSWTGEYFAEPAEGTA